MNRRTKVFLDKLIENPKATATQAYLDTHQTNNRHVARVNSSKTLAKTSSQVYLKIHVDNAITHMIEMGEDMSVKPETRLKVYQDFIDRFYGKAELKQKVETTSVNLNLEGSKEMADNFAAFLKSQSSK